MSELDDLTEQEYHAHPALSYSTGKHYLRSPAHYRYAVDHRTEKPAFDVGHAVHALVLGVGQDIVEIEYDSYRSKAARAERDAAYEAGKTPIKTDDLAPIREAAEAILANPDARRLLEQPGIAEARLIGTDPDTAVQIRGMLDWLPTGPGIPVDLKTTVDASPRKVRRVIADLDYDLQAAMYDRLLRINGREDCEPMAFIFAEKEPPYGVFVLQVSHPDWIGGGHMKLDTILRRHADCLRTQDWSQAYPPGVWDLPPLGYYLSAVDEAVDPTAVTEELSL